MAMVGAFDASVHRSFDGNDIEIAAALIVSEHTVARHVQNIFTSSA